MGNSSLIMRDALARCVVFFGLIGAMLGILSRNTVVDFDMFHSMALFREAIATGWIPSEDMFSYIPTISPVIHHEWGTGALLYLVTVSSGLGATGLMVTKYLLSATVVMGCYLYVKRQGVSVAVFAPLALIAIPIGKRGFTTIRAQLFTLLFLVILLLFLQEDRHRKRWWIAIWLPLYAIWVNLHAGFVVGIGLMALHTLERFLAGVLNGERFSVAFGRVKHLAAIVAVMVFMIVLNPYGLRYIPHLWRAILLDRSALVAEWRPIWDLTHGPGCIPMVILFSLSISIIAYTVSKRKLRNMPELLFLLVAAGQSLLHNRHLSIYAIVWFCCTPGYVEETEFGQLLKSVWRNKKKFMLVIWMVCGILGSYCAIRFQFWHLRIPTTLAEHEKEGAPIYPVGAVNYLAENTFSGNMIVPFHAGSYVSWKLYPDVKVSIDSRFEAAYAPELVAEHIRFYAAHDNWRKTLNRYATDAVLVPRYSPLDNLLDQSAVSEEKESIVEWRKVYMDDGFSLFLRTERAKRFPVVDNRGKPITAGFP